MIMPDVKEENDDLDMRWPTASDRAFVSAPPAYGAWTAEDGRERLWRMIRGYRDAADFLVTKTESEPHVRANLIYPIVFSYRHALELALKQLLEDYGHWAGHAPDFRQHRLEFLWPKCREVIEQFNPGADPAPLDALAKLVGEFSDVDPGSFAFRYASDTAGRRIDIKISCIDLLELRNAMAGVHNFLECVGIQIHEASEL